MKTSDFISLVLAVTFSLGISAVAWCALRYPLAMLLP